MRKSILMLVVVASVAALGVAAAQQPAAPAPGFTRTPLQDQPLDMKDHHGVMSRSDFQPGAESGRHMHRAKSSVISSRVRSS